MNNPSVTAVPTRLQAMTGILKYVVEYYATYISWII